MTVDVFGRQFTKSKSDLKLVSNGGLNSTNDLLSVKIDSNNRNILSCSANGLLVQGLKVSGGILRENLEMDGHRISNLADPENSEDAVNKQYVDSVTNTKISNSGGSMTGELNMQNNKITNVGLPELENDASNKKYCDDIRKDMLNRNRGVMIGALDMSWNHIVNLNFPDYPTDATNKIYVQILNQKDEVSLPNLISICNILSPFLQIDPNVQRFRAYFNMKYISVMSIIKVINNLFKLHSQEVST